MKICNLIILNSFFIQNFSLLYGMHPGEGPSGSQSGWINFGGGSVSQSGWINSGQELQQLVEENVCIIIAR
ncbi:unnamed protein product [Meloidogyne enterolobii]|uniref:Uncharacterized protein n=1 Tax=Meloidogyne enterolobii TaxID=390850 RepID=A0ACB0YNM2_MELEN